MENKTFDAIFAYKSAMAQARLMLSKGLINAAELATIEEKMCEIYCINFGSLYRDIDWINTPFRGNMVAGKEAV